jgi:hypothetical protein
MKTYSLTFLFLILLLVPFVNGQGKIVPIIELNSGALVGGVGEKGQWIDAKTTVKSISGETPYKTYQLTYSIKTGNKKYPKPEDAGVPCEGYFSVNDESSKQFGIAIGANANWEAAPRALAAIDVNNVVYTKAVADMLRTKRLVNSKIRITKAYRVDLEGDGQDEVLIEATSYTSYAKPTAKRGDYSLVLLRKIVAGKVQNILVTGDFVTKNIEFGAPGKFELSAIADLNGDGKMEIVISGSYYEGHWLETYEMKADKPLRVKPLDVGCGV